MSEVNANADEAIDVVTTAAGAMPTTGLVPVGTEMNIPLSRFSAAWMRPANASAGKLVNALLEKRRAEREKAAEQMALRRDLSLLLKR